MRDMIDGLVPNQNSGSTLTVILRVRKIHGLDIYTRIKCIIDMKDMINKIDMIDMRDMIRWTSAQSELWQYINSHFDSKKNRWIRYIYTRIKCIIDMKDMMIK